MRQLEQTCSGFDQPKGFRQITHFAGNSNSKLIFRQALKKATDLLFESPPLAIPLPKKRGGGFISPFGYAPHYCGIVRHVWVPLIKPHIFPISRHWPASRALNVKRGIFPIHHGYILFQKRLLLGPDGKILNKAERDSDASYETSRPPVLNDLLSRQ